MIATAVTAFAFVVCMRTREAETRGTWTSRAHAEHKAAKITRDEARQVALTPTSAAVMACSDATDYHHDDDDDDDEQDQAEVASLTSRIVTPQLDAARLAAIAGDALAAARIDRIREEKRRASYDGNNDRSPRSVTSSSAEELACVAGLPPSVVQQLWEMRSCDPRGAGSPRLALRGAQTRRIPMDEVREYLGQLSRSPSRAGELEV